MNLPLLASAQITSVGVRFGVRSGVPAPRAELRSEAYEGALNERIPTNRAGVVMPSVCLAAGRDLGRSSYTHEGSVTGYVGWAVPQARYALNSAEAGITPVMSVHRTTRQPWQIDLLLARVVGHDVRMAGRAFAPGLPRCDDALRFMQVADLILPDGSQPGAVPVFFEGRLREFERRIGVVVVSLDAVTGRDSASEGWIQFRGNAAVVLHGPALVELASPFHVERLPPDTGNYWRDVRWPRVQFEFDFPPTGRAALPQHPSSAPGVAPTPPESRRQGQRQR